MAHSDPERSWHLAYGVQFAVAVLVLLAVVVFGDGGGHYHLYATG